MYICIYYGIYHTVQKSVTTRMQFVMKVTGSSLGDAKNLFVGVTWRATASDTCRIQL